MHKFYIKSDTIYSKCFNLYKFSLLVHELICKVLKACYYCEDNFEIKVNFCIQDCFCPADFFWVHLHLQTIFSPPPSPILEFTLTIE